MIEKRTEAIAIEGKHLDFDLKIDPQANIQFLLYVIAYF